MKSFDRFVSPQKIQELRSSLEDDLFNEIPEGKDYKVVSFSYYPTPYPNVFEFSVVTADRKIYVALYSETDGRLTAFVGRKEDLKK